MFLVIAGAIALAAALAVACDGGSSPRGTPTSTATTGVTPGVTVLVGSPTATEDAGDGETPTPAASPSPEQPLLEEMVLQADDLPAGLVRVSAITSTNEDVASGSPDPQAQMAVLAGWGRLLGYDVTFQPGPDAPDDLPIRGLNSTASIYKTADGAHESFADGAETARTEDWSTSYPNLSDLTVREISQPGLADEVVWIRVSGFQGTDKSAMLVDDYILMRRDRVRAFLRVTTFFPASASQDAYKSEVAALAARQVQRIDSAIAGG